MSGATVGEDRFPGGGFGTGGYTIQFSRTVTAIPEPSTLALMGVGMAGLAVSPLRRRNKARPSSESVENTLRLLSGRPEARPQDPNG
jgi:hypothetical protein